MIDIASLVVIGRLTRDAEVKTLPSGDLVVNFSVASNSRKKQGEEWVDAPVYLDVQHFPRGDGGWLQYLTKGKQVGVQGDLRMDTWEKDGERRSKLYCAARNIELLASPRGEGDAPALGGDRDTPMWEGQLARGGAAADNASDFGGQPRKGTWNQRSTYAQRGPEVSASLRPMGAPPPGDPFAPQQPAKPAPAGQGEFEDVLY